ncbi:unnamed protein product [[Actinomadura] parvosata subsp. kistnae]|uniref:hypothetical protein n=1 Tax=[Actinomadura] parvosata TaxID=1955412 RepID=UPI000D2A7053|nr:hypothetical protein [Nonomuraea sp. ATCC 55076]SPL93667.1 unnamed protein product [Actinomadura parvosata subsp. kistnae]
MRLIYREEALRERERGRASARRPAVARGPSFLVLWIAAAIVVTAGIGVTALALGTLR